MHISTSPSDKIKPVYTYYKLHEFKNKNAGTITRWLAIPLPFGWEFIIDRWEYFNEPVYKYDYCKFFQKRTV